MPTKDQIETALKDINSVYQNDYGIYRFIGGTKRIETEEITMILNTVPDSIKIIKQLLTEKLKETN